VDITAGWGVSYAFAVTVITGSEPLRTPKLVQTVVDQERRSPNANPEPTTDVLHYCAGYLASSKRLYPVRCVVQGPDGAIHPVKPYKAAVVIANGKVQRGMLSAHE
jgi:hypothetical protein